MNGDSSAWGAVVGGGCGACQGERARAVLLDGLVVICDGEG